MKVMCYGNACLLAQNIRKNILLDLFISNNPFSFQINFNIIQTYYISIFN